MTERIVNIPTDQDWETPPGCYVIQYYHSNNPLASTRPFAVRLTDDPMHCELIQVLRGETDYGASLRDYSERLSEAVNLGSEPSTPGYHPGKPFDYNEAVKPLFEKPDEHHPEYYRSESGLEPWDVIKAFKLDYWRGEMVAYLLRAGVKPGSTEYDDLRKVYTICLERLRQLEKERYPLHVMTFQEDNNGPKPHGPTNVE